MSIFSTVKQFFGVPTAPVVRAESGELSVAEPAQPSLPLTDWEVTTGRLQGTRQERNVTYHNNEISGTCNGKIGELTGSVMIGLFEDLPTWLPSLFIRVTVRADEGELRASLRESNGSVVSAEAPDTFEGNAELVGGRVWLRCESGSEPARNVHYEVVIA